ncbi:MAG: hydantoinase/oxoprolinase family protein, partial [Proteobacteria bacterium]|nr:hydantoinase/oxoprolinase family protein [Pseudomonadota bacterium]
MINIHTIGAGGGSIAYIDDGGLLQVGPESAGASPGPACYGQGGTSATVTDANLILGRIPKGIRLGESLTIDFANAEVAIAKLTKSLGLASDGETATGIIKLANERMAQALRVISVERGIDPGGFCLMAFGGAGGLHVCELAEQLGMTQAVAPNHAGVLSALGMLVAKPGRHITHTIGCLLKDIDEYQIEEEINKLTIQARQVLTREGHNTEKTIDTTALDLCYHGQAHTLMVPWSNKTDCENSFHQLHLSRYGHRLETPVELVNIRVGIELEQDLSLNFGTNHATNDLQVDNQGSFLWRSQLVPGDVIVGERIICDPDSTIWVAPGWQAVKDQFGNVVLTKL